MRYSPRTYRVLCRYVAKLTTPALKRYTNGLMLEMGKYLDQTGDALAHFGKDGEHGLSIGRHEPETRHLVKGVKAIQIAQDRSKEQLLNMSTVVSKFGIPPSLHKYQM